MNETRNKTTNEIVNEMIRESSDNLMQDAYKDQGGFEVYLSTAKKNLLDASKNVTSLFGNYSASLAHMNTGINMRIENTDSENTNSSAIAQETIDSIVRVCPSVCSREKELAQTYETLLGIVDKFKVIKDAYEESVKQYKTNLNSLGMKVD